VPAVEEGQQPRSGLCDGPRRHCRVTAGRPAGQLGLARRRS
jgi:hypothetical protein